MRPNLARELQIDVVGMGK